MRAYVRKPDGTLAAFDAPTATIDLIDAVIDAVHDAYADTYKDKPSGAVLVSIK